MADPPYEEVLHGSRIAFTLMNQQSRPLFVNACAPANAAPVCPSLCRGGAGRTRDRVIDRGEVRAAENTAWQCDPRLF